MLAPSGSAGFRIPFSSLQLFVVGFFRLGWVGLAFFFFLSFFSVFDFRGGWGIWLFVSLGFVFVCKMPAVEQIWKLDCFSHRDRHGTGTA